MTIPYPQVAMMDDPADTAYAWECAGSDARIHYNLVRARMAWQKAQAILSGSTQIKRWQPPKLEGGK